MNMKELSPCPFCLGRPEIALYGFGTASVQCTCCGASGYRGKTEEAVDAWNNRAERRELKQRRAENAEIVAVYDKLHKHSIVGAHWLWVVVAQAAESGDAEQALRDRGFVRLPDGWVAVPLAPTEEMIVAFSEAAVPGAWAKSSDANKREARNGITKSHLAMVLAAAPPGKLNDGAASLNSGAAKKD